MNDPRNDLGEKFWNELLAWLVDKGRCIPKFQVERAIGPILGFFLEGIMSRLVDGEVVTLAAEFPLKKGNGFQSTNIDWLMYDRRARELLAVELKTERGSFREDQLGTYLDLALGEKPWARLKAGFAEICEVSRSRKYESARTELECRAAGCDGIDQARLKVLYLAPGSTGGSFESACGRFAERHPGATIADRVKLHSFESVRRCIDADPDHEFAHYREMLCDALCMLDKDVAFGGEDEDGRFDYEGLASLDEILRLCRDAENESVRIGFDGGKTALRKQHMARLQARKYKWIRAAGERPEAMVGRIGGNWIRACEFVGVIEEVRSRRVRSEEVEAALLDAFRHALRANPELRIAQMVARAWTDAPSSLEDVSDEAFLKSLSRPA